MNDFVRSVPGGSGLRQVVGVSIFNIDPYLLSLLVVIGVYGLAVLRTFDGNGSDLYFGQLARLALGFFMMFCLAQLSPWVYLRWAPILYLLGILMLVLVMFVGVSAKGSQRWLEVPGLPRFQPSEMMKIVVPLTVAWYFRERTLPPRFLDIVASLFIVVIPVVLVIRQPDLGSGVLIASSGIMVLFLTGIHWRWIVLAACIAGASLPVFWQFFTDYQKQRVLTWFNPESDPLGSGWNTIQSTTAIGSGGLFGKGLGQGTQSQLHFLPESHTDFMVAVIGEELGFIGIITLLVLYILVLGRGLYISILTPDTFGRLVSASLSIVFFFYVFANVAIACGLLPVTGFPLPLVSYGGTSAITLLAGFGIVMSIHSHRSWRD